MKRILFWGAVFGLLALLPRDTVYAEPPTHGEMVTITKAQAEEQLAKYRASLAAVAELSSQLDQMAGRVESCMAGFGSIHRPGPVIGG